MTMILNLTPEQETRLRSFAQAQGKDAETLLADWVETLPPAPEAEPPKPRIAGLHEGWITYIAPDFDDPLPDSFWFPDDEEDELIGTTNNSAA